MPTIHTKPLSTNTRSWSDLDLDFTAHPVTKDIVLKKDVEAIKKGTVSVLLLRKCEEHFLEDPDMIGPFFFYIFYSFCLAMVKNKK